MPTYERVFMKNPTDFQADKAADTVIASDGESVATKQRPSHCA